MGKISDALERHQKETSIKTERLPLGKEQQRIDRSPALKPPGKSFIPEGFNSKLVVLSAPQSLEAENFKTLRSQILFPKNDKSPRTILVTSAFPGEGKTFVSSNLAVTIALGINEYVLLVDCDFRSPDLHNMFSCSNAQGLTDRLTGRKDLPELLIKTKIEKLSLLTAGRPPSNPAELLSSTSMKEFVDEVKARYEDRYIILDATPSQITAEANVLANYVDGVIFVVMAEKSPRDVIERNIEDMNREKILGIVFNGYRPKYKSYHGYYHR